MAKITIIGSAVVITSTLKLEGIKKVAKYKPEALKLMDDDSNVRFKIGVGTSHGSVSKYGIEFSANAGADGAATATIMLPDDVKTEDAKAYIVDNYAMAIKSLIDIEANITESIEEIIGIETSVMGAIEG